MSQSYNKPCIYCKQEIVMSDRTSGNWLPYDLNGQVHDCKSSNTGTKKVETKDKDKEWVSTPEAKAWVREIMEGPKIKELDERLKRVEALSLRLGNKMIHAKKLELLPFGDGEHMKLIRLDIPIDNNFLEVLSELCKVKQWDLTRYIKQALYDAVNLDLTSPTEIGLDSMQESKRDYSSRRDLNHIFKH